jgi:serine/threonine-protein kinase
MAAAAPLSGTLLGHYRVLEQIGAGGMGVVYRAHDEHLGRDVALKVLPSGALADEQSRKRFRKEAQALSRLNHPNIATIHDFDTHEGVDFIITEYIPGITLDEKLAATRLTEAQSVHLAIQLAQGLEAAHKHGVVHRDLKPSNVRVTSEGALKILDFGLARMLQPLSEQDTTESVGAVGTLTYAAPEQLLSGEVDARADIYSFGAVLHKMATGQRPFSEFDGARLIDAILRQPPARPRKINPATSSELERIILKCLEKNPEYRYQSAAEITADLRRLEAPSTPSMLDVSVEREWRKRFTVLAVLALVAAALLLAPRARDWRRSLWHNTARPIRSLAVLPLANLSQDPSQDYFADGMTEALTSELAQIRSLRVISRTSAMQYKGAKKTVPQIADELNVDAVAEGSVQRVGNQVAISVELIYAPSDSHLWGKTFERELRDVLGLEREVARAIAAEIKVTLAPAEVARLSSAPQVNPAAHEAYLKGRYAWLEATTTRRLQAKDYFEQAITIDPDYAPAYAGLADYYWVTTNIDASVAISKARQNVLKALELDPGSAHVHRSLAAIDFYGDWDWANADTEFRRAIELSPNDSESHRLYSVFLSAMKRPDDARSEIQRALDLDPLSASTLTTAGWNSYFARQFDDAGEFCRRALQLDPTSANANECLASIYLAQGHYNEAIPPAQRAASLSQSDAIRVVTLGRAFALAGRRAEAKRILSQLQERPGYVPPYYLAKLLVALDDPERASAMLDRAYQDHESYLPFINVDEALDPLREDSHFRSLLARLKLPQ